MPHAAQTHKLSCDKLILPISTLITATYVSLSSNVVVSAEEPPHLSRARCPTSLSLGHGHRSTVTRGSMRIRGGVVIKSYVQKIGMLPYLVFHLIASVRGLDHRIMPHLIVITVVDLDHLCTRKPGVEIDRSRAPTLT